MNVLVTGAGGMIGGHLVKRLLDQGHSVRTVDVKPVAHWWQVHPQAENLVKDLSDYGTCDQVVVGVNFVYNLACNMGGIGFIEAHKFDCAMSVLITAHMLQAAIDAEVVRFFQASSACVYPTYLQDDPKCEALKESDAWPAQPEEGYGEEKLYGERLCQYARSDYGLETRVARYHNVFGPHGSWYDGREKSPAALCRKIAEAKLTGRNELRIWGDGEQTRSYLYVDDCIDGSLAVMNSPHAEPFNVGSDRMVTVNQLADMIEDIAGTKLERVYELDAPQGVRGRSSDNSNVRSKLGWEPQISLEQGLAYSYAWIEDQVQASLK